MDSDDMLAEKSFDFFKQEDEGKDDKENKLYFPIEDDNDKQIESDLSTLNTLELKLIPTEYNSTNSSKKIIQRSFKLLNNELVPADKKFKYQKIQIFNKSTLLIDEDNDEDSEQIPGDNQLIERNINFLLPIDRQFDTKELIFDFNDRIINIKLEYDKKHLKKLQEKRTLIQKQISANQMKQPHKQFYPQNIYQKSQIPQIMQMQNYIQKQQLINQQGYITTPKPQTYQRQQPQLNLQKPMFCKCQKQKCLQKYCVCLNQGKFCSHLCQCLDCQNNKKAFLQKINLQSKMQNIDQEKKLKTQLLHRNYQKHTKKVCTCRKSKCRKKYCECYRAGKACGDQCSCDGCQNPFNQNNQENLKDQDQDLLGSTIRKMIKISPFIFRQQNQNYQQENPYQQQQQMSQCQNFYYTPGIRFPQNQANTQKLTQTKEKQQNVKKEEQRQINISQSLLEKFNSSANYNAPKIKKEAEKPKFQDLKNIGLKANFQTEKVN